MREIVQWLIAVEQAAGLFYRGVAERFADDEKVATFFLHLAADEDLHLQLLQDARDHLVLLTNADPPVTVDEEIRDRIEGAFARNKALVSSSEYRFEDVLDCLAITEFSEWNDIFVFAVNTLKEDRRFNSVAAEMTHHVREIESFLDSSAEGRKYLHIVKSLPPVWHEQILVIDDDPAIAEFLKSLLSHTGQVDLAGNGSEGLKMVKERHYDAVICDVQMPVMDGMEFFRQASSFDPKISERILFFTGAPSPELVEFLRDRDLRVLIKPAPIREIVRKVAEIMPGADRERKKRL